MQPATLQLQSARPPRHFRPLALKQIDRHKLHLLPFHRNVGSDVDNGFNKGVEQPTGKGDGGNQHHRAHRHTGNRGQRLLPPAQEMPHGYGEQGFQHDELPGKR